MANSGTLTSSKMSGTGLYMKFTWSISDIDNAAGTGILHYKLVVGGTDTVFYRMFGTGDRNYCKIDGEDIYRISDVGNGTTSNRYKLYSRESKHNTTGYASTSDGWTFNGYYRTYGTLAEGSKIIYYDDDGNTSFSVLGAFQCLYGASSDKRVWIEANQIVPDQIERFSKSYISSNNGNNWNQTKYVYKTTDYGTTWTKCNLYKTTNNGSNWNKIT